MSEKLHNFDSLKRFLEERGIEVGEAKGYIPITPEDVFDRQGKTPISFESSHNGEKGIFATDRFGREHQVFMYKHKYRLDTYGNPRFHICKCQVIAQFMNDGRFDEYYFANTDKVDVFDLDNKINVEVEQLPLCKFCSEEFLIKYGRNLTTEDFVDILKKAGEVPDEQGQETDLFGYVKDWKKISTAYRKLHHYTCENCGFEASNPLDQMFIHVHHIDGNKLNNRESNFKCLCIKCHAEVDEAHRKNFSEGDKKKQLENFLKRQKMK